jgi:hypothetical protein
VQLDDYSRIFCEKPLTPPAEGQVLRLPSRDAARLHCLHAQACRLAGKKPQLLAHPEVARAIEQDLIRALVTCLTGANVKEERRAKRLHARIMVRCDEVLAERPDGLRHIPELCERVGVNDRTLRLCCAEFLGISPHQVCDAAAAEGDAQSVDRRRPF